MIYEIFFGESKFPKLPHCALCSVYGTQILREIITFAQCACIFGFIRNVQNWFDVRYELSEDFLYIFTRNRARGFTIRSMCNGPIFCLYDDRNLILFCCFSPYSKTPKLITVIINPMTFLVINSKPLLSLSNLLHCDSNQVLLLLILPSCCWN